MTEEDQAGSGRGYDCFDPIHFALTDQGGRIGPRTPLVQGSHNLGPGTSRQLLELGHSCIDLVRVRVRRVTQLRLPIVLPPEVGSRTARQHSRRAQFAALPRKVDCNQHSTLSVGRRSSSRRSTCGGVQPLRVREPVS